MVSLHINHLPMELNERTDLTTLAGTVKKKVNGLIGVYSLLIFGTILLFLVVTALILVIMWGLYSSGNLHSRIFAYGMIVVVAAGYCLWVVLKPVFKIFRRPKEKGVEIGREGHEELFALIDEVVKEVDCLQPKQVRLSNECNAYVYYPNLFGYLSKGRQQNLTIGYPLVYGLNKTELKAILAHEFGHFTQKSVSTNRTANLSEFICASIALYETVSPRGSLQRDPLPGSGIRRRPLFPDSGGYGCRRLSAVQTGLPRRAVERIHEPALFLPEGPEEIAGGCHESLRELLQGYGRPLRCSYRSRSPFDRAPEVRRIEARLRGQGRHAPFDRGEGGGHPLIPRQGDGVG